MNLYPITLLSSGFSLRQTNLISVILFILFTLCTGCDKEEPTQSTISGVVMDSNKKSMANVKVVLKTPEGKDSTITTDNGSYSFSNLGHHTYSVTVSKTGYKQDEYLFMMDGKTNQSKNITMLSYSENAVFKISPNTVTVDYKYNQSLTNITSNMAWSCTDTVSWIELLVLEGTGNKIVSFNINENTTTTQRKAVFVFKTGYDKTDSLTIIQKATPGPSPNLIATNFKTDSINANKKLYLLFDQKVTLKSISFGTITFTDNELITESFADGKGIRFPNLSLPLCANIKVEYFVKDVKVPERLITGTFDIKTYTNSISTSGVDNFTYINNKNILWWISTNSSSNLAYFKLLDLNALVPEIKSTVCRNANVQFAYNPAKDMIYASYYSSNALYRYNVSTGTFIDSAKRSFTMPINSFAFTKSGVGVFMTDNDFFTIETMNNNATKQLTSASIFKNPNQTNPRLAVDKISSCLTDEVCIVTSLSSNWYGFINVNSGYCYLNKPTDYPNKFSPTTDGKYILTTQSEKSIINPQTNTSEFLFNVAGLFATPTYFDNNSNVILTASGATLKLTNRSANQVINIKTYGEGDVDNIIYPVKSDYFVIEKNSMYWIVKKSILKP